MDKVEMHTARAHFVAGVQAGQSWQAAATSVGIQISRATAYRLLHRFRIEGTVALDDQRHGHPTKLRQPVRAWLAAFCRVAPASAGRMIQAALLERFSLEVSISQINRLRAALGVGHQVSGAGENQPNEPQAPPTCQEGAGSLLLLAAAQGRTVVTILRTNQYQGLASFTEVGDFVPLCRDRAGVVTREVASARFALPVPDHPDQTLRLAVALIRDWRTPMPCVPAKATLTEQERWDAIWRGRTGAGGGQTGSSARPQRLPPNPSSFLSSPRLTWSIRSS